MTIHRFFYDGPYSEGVRAELDSSESSHALKVLRLRAGDAVILMNGNGQFAEASLAPFEQSRSRSAVCLMTRVWSVAPAAFRLHLYLAPPKSHSMDFILKSATELGIATLTPIICKYGIVKPDGDTLQSWRQTVVNAIKQSTNAWLPEIRSVKAFSDAVSQSPEGFFGAVPTATDVSCGELLCRERPVDCALWIGPEGGFTPEEENQLRIKGLLPLTIGNWILRVETAVIALLASLRATESRS